MLNYKWHIDEEPTAPPPNPFRIPSLAHYHLYARAFNAVYHRINSIIAAFSMFTHVLRDGGVEQGHFLTRPRDHRGMYGGGWGEWTDRYNTLFEWILLCTYIYVALRTYTCKMYTRRSNNIYIINCYWDDLRGGCREEHSDTYTHVCSQRENSNRKEMLWLVNTPNFSAALLPPFHFSL